MARRSTRPSSLTSESSGNARRVKTRTGRGTFSPGMKVLGTGNSAASNRVASVRIKKQVNPLGGQGSARVGAGGRYANMNTKVINAKVSLVSRTVRPNAGSNVVRPPRTAVRVMSGGRGKIRNV